MGQISKRKNNFVPVFAALRPNQSFFLFFLLAACQSRDISPKISGSEYYPLKGGAFWSYDVTETTITQLGGQTTAVYELKVQITDSVVSTGQTTYILQRFKRANAAAPWAATTTWSARKDPFQAVQQEGNVPFVKLSFPLSEGKSWNGNALNALGGSDKCSDGTFACDNYVVQDIGKRFEMGSLFFNDSITVLENNESDPIVEKDIRKSVYVKGTGLVYREVTLLQYCTQGDCIGNQIVENGSIIKQIMKDHGAL
jgi:hypothetical protein